MQYNMQIIILGLSKKKEGEGRLKLFGIKVMLKECHTCIRQFFSHVHHDVLKIGST